MSLSRSKSCSCLILNHFWIAAPFALRFLQLLYLEDNSYVELVQLSHFLFLEVSYLILSLREVLINILLFIFQTFLCVLQLTDIDLNLLFTVIEL